MMSTVQNWGWISGMRRRAASGALALMILLQAALIAAQSAQAQTEASSYEVLYAFTGGADGGVPVASLVRDSAGNLYGTTEYRGTSDWGVVFKLDANDKESVLHSFTGGADGATPRARLVLDSAGNLYGTALQGGAACGFFTCGVVFKLDSSGNETVLHSFGGTDGANPEAGLLRDSAGNLYGTTSAGGSGYGVVFKLDPTIGKETVLYTFTGGGDGAQPIAGLIPDSAGNLYSITQGGGDFSTCITDGCGVVFKLDPTNGKETVLYTFTGGADGRYPSGDLIQDSAGNLYGTTSAGGASCISSGIGCGVVFKLDPTTGKETVLYTFTGGADGAAPGASLFMDDAGILYGTAGGGISVGCGGGGCGVVFKLDPTTGKETVLYTFTGGTDGGQPAAGLIRDSGGNFYGTAGTAGISGNCGIGCGVVFKLTPTEASFNVSVVLAGNGSGAVKSNPAGISCGTTCSASFASGSGVTLTATAASGSGFSGWSGACSGTGACSLTVTAAESLTATFNLLASPDFSLSASALVPSTVSPGASSMSTVDVTATGGFSGSVALSCSVQPSPALAPKCSISPGSTAPGNPAMLTVSTTGPTGALHSSTGSGLFYALWLPLLGLVGAGVSVGAEQSRKGKIPAVVLALASVLFAGLVFQVACGGGSRTIGGGGGTPAGTYTITVTGTDTSGSLKHSTTTMLTVQ